MEVRWVDQTQYPMIVVALLSAVPQSCRTPLPNQYLDCMLLAVYTHTHTVFHTPWPRGTYATGPDLVARLGAVSRPWRRGTLRGRRGTWRHPPSVRVAGVALGDIHLRFAWELSTYATGLDLVARLAPVRDLH